MAERINARRAHMQSFVDRFRAKATKAKQAQARLKALEKLPVIESVVEDAPSQFSFPEPSPLPPPMLTMDRVSVGYGDTTILSHLTLRIDMEDRIALLGANGNGKSTFAKLVAGRLAPQSGTMSHSPRLRVGYFAQHQAEELRPDETPVDHMARALPDATPVAVRSQLARFGLDAARAETVTRDLSGGEKARLLLALATRDAPHLLILDEPTNHLDLDARDALIRALAEFEGAVLLISHDPHLVELVADRLWLVGDGAVRTFEGDMTEYRTWLIERARAVTSGGESARPAAAPRREDRRERAEARKALAPLRRRIRDAEARMTKLAAEQAKVEARLADPTLYEAANSADEVTKLNTRLAALRRDHEAAEEDWLAAETELEEAGTE